MSYVNPLSVACPYVCCKASLSEPCPRVGAHPSRIEAAAKAMGLSDDEAAQLAQDMLTARINRYRAQHGASSLAVEPLNPAEGEPTPSEA